MPRSFRHVAALLFGPPLAIKPDAARSIITGPIGRRIVAGESLDLTPAEPRQKYRAALASDGPQIIETGSGGSFALTGDGVAVIPVTGILSRRFDFISAACGWSTYDGLGAALSAAIGDDRVRGILLDVDSPGGEAAGMIDVADTIIAFRQVKPIFAIADSTAASAAYAIAGSASRLFVPRIAEVGSIGCVVIHCDQTGADVAQGLKYSAVFSGARKIDGWGHAALSPDARAAAQASVDHVASSFAALVGRQGRISAKVAMATDAALFADAAAVAAGLADRVGNFHQAMAALVAAINETAGSPAPRPGTSSGASASDLWATVQSELRDPASRKSPLSGGSSEWDSVVAKLNAEAARRF